MDRRRIFFPNPLLAYLLITSETLRKKAVSSSFVPINTSYFFACCFQWDSTSFSLHKGANPYFKPKGIPAFKPYFTREGTNGLYPSTIFIRSVSFCKGVVFLANSADIFLRPFRNPKGALWIITR